MAKVLVAGATGQLGRYIARRLKQEGHWVRALARNPAKLEALRSFLDASHAGDLTHPSTLRGVCRDVDAVISCAGAPLNFKLFSDRGSFTAIDLHGNKNLLAEARAARVGKFVYVSVSTARRLLHTEYAAAHEGFVEALEATELKSTVIRPTGFFSVYANVFAMAQRGVGLIIGDGSPRTNPVHEEDVAEVCVEALASEEKEVGVGGPNTFMRRQIFELAFEVLGKKPRLLSVSPAVFRAAIAPVALPNRRIHAFLAFGLEVNRIDILSPARGKRHLRDYFASLTVEAGRS